MNIRQVLGTVDRHAAEFDFPVLDNAYVQFATARLSAYLSADDWLIIFEVLGFSLRENTFVDDVYAFGSCTAKEGYIGEIIVLEQDDDFPLFDADTQECIADWSNWSVRLYGRRLSFSPSREEYHRTGIDIDRPAGRGSLREIELMRFLVGKLDGLSLFPNEATLFNEIGACKNLPKFVTTTKWHHPDIAAGEVPSRNICVRSLVTALANCDRGLFSPGLPNTDWRFWERGDCRG